MNLGRRGRRKLLEIAVEAEDDDPTRQNDSDHDENSTGDDVLDHLRIADPSIVDENPASDGSDDSKDKRNDLCHLYP